MKFLNSHLWCSQAREQVKDTQEKPAEGAQKSMPETEIEVIFLIEHELAK